MNRKKFPTPCFGFGRLTAIAITSLCLAATSAEAVEKTYRFYRFVTIGMKNENDTIQLGEFTFSLNGTVLNTNDRNADNVDVVPVIITAGEQDPQGFEGPAEVGDGDLGTKWLKYLPFGEAEALTFEFESPVTIDSYNWGSGNDSVGYSRSPISWQFEGSSDGLTWDVLDIRYNYPIQNDDLTYQAGFDIPDAFPPAILHYRIDTQDPLGSAGIVLNGSPVRLEWNTVFSDDVSIFPAPGAVDPSSTGVEVYPPANSTLAYTLTAGSTGVTETASSTVNVRTVTGGEATYQFVRFTATKLGNGTPNGLVQLAEFSFVNDGELVEVSSVSNPGGFSYEGEEVTNLIDGDGVGNKWLDLDNAPVIFDFGEEKTFDGYSFYTANDLPERDPIQWTLEGSNDATTWTRIEDVNFDYPTPLFRNVSTRDIPLPGPSLVARLNSFTGSSQTLLQGEPLVLSWSVDGAASIEIDQGVGTVSPGEGSVVVTPAPALGETTYTLTASSLGGTVTGTFTVSVIPMPETTTIAYDDFSSTGDELSLRGSTTIFGNVLRLTPDENDQMGEAWFRLRQPVADGFEATFGMSMNQDAPNGIVSADGLAFVIQNSPAGSEASSNGENGVATNALNIKFKSFGFSPFEASQLQVLAGTTVLDTRSIDLTPGTMLHGLPAGEGGGPFPYTLGSPAGKAPYQIRIVYVPGAPGHLDIYFDGIAIVQNLDVDLAEIGAVDANGDAFVGFSARTGGNVQNNDITAWKMAYGDFSALPPFGLVKANYRRDYSGGVVGVPVFDLVWNAEDDVFYEVESSPDLNPESWTTYESYDPVAGQIGVRLPVTESRMFYRVVEVE
jgi:hypothetical protein